MKAEPAISVVIATYNRAETLQITLEKIAGQTLAAEQIEVVISDDGSPDNTGEVVAQCREALGLNLVYHRHENSGVGYTQNRGIELASAPIVLLIADDIWLEPEALRTHVDAHRRFPQDNAAFIGKVLQSPRMDQSAFLRRWEPFPYDRFSDYQEMPFYFFWANQISCKRACLERHGMFKENMARAVYAAHEDSELGYRLHRATDLTIRYLADAVGFHYHITTFEAELKRSYGRGINWFEFRQLFDLPEISVGYRVLTWRTLGDHLETFRTSRRQNLLPGDRNPLRLAVHYLARGVVFNRATVNLLWLPLLQLAEKRPAFERFCRSAFYHGVLSYYFRKGCADAFREQSRTAHLAGAN